MYRVHSGRRVDGVVATDPVALSYLLQATGPVLLPEFFPESIRSKEGGASGDRPEMDLTALTHFVKQQLQANSTSLYQDYQAHTDRHVLGLVLEHTRGNLSRAAKHLGITRATLRTKLQSLGVLGISSLPAGDDHWRPFRGVDITARGD